MRRIIILSLTVVLISLLSACNRAGEVELIATTTTEPPPTTTTTAPTTTTTTSTSAADSDDEGVVVESYEIVVRSATDDGELLWVVIPPGDYTPVALEGLITTIIEETDVPLWAIHVYDDPAALEAGRVDEANRTPEEESLVESHHLISLIQGSVVSFEGPFSEHGEYILGS